MSEPDRNGASGAQPPLAPGLALLIVAAALIVVVLINPPMPGWVRTTIAVVALLVVLALMIYAFTVFRGATRRARRGRR